MSMEQNAIKDEAFKAYLFRSNSEREKTPDYLTALKLSPS